MKNTAYIIIVIVLVVLGGYLAFSKKSELKDGSLVTNNAYSTSTDQFATITNQSNLSATSTDTAQTIATTTKIIKNKMHKITLETNKGTIVFETYDADAPNTVNNFITLSNKNFYNGVIFHRVIEGFMIQGGDPTGTGRGGPDYRFDDELNPETASYKEGYTRGTVAMANAGPNTNGSQFFIMHKDTPLPKAYTIFGKVVSGMEVVDKIATVPTDPNDRPLENIVINKVTVSDAN